MASVKRWIIFFITLLISINWIIGSSEKAVEDGTEQEEEEEGDEEDEESGFSDDKLKIEVIKAINDCELRSDEGDTIHWKYHGTLLDGKVFDSGTYSATLGAGQVITGVDKGMRGMCVGEKRKMTIHPDWAYGERGYPDDIPPHATLVFDVELLSINRPDESHSEL